MVGVWCTDLSTIVTQPPQGGAAPRLWTPTTPAKLTVGRWPPGGGGLGEGGSGRGDGRGVGGGGGCLGGLCRGGGGCQAPPNTLTSWGNPGHSRRKGGGRGVLPYMFNVFVSQKRMSVLQGIFGKRCELGGYMTLPFGGSGPGCIAPCLAVSGTQSMERLMKGDQKEPPTSSSSNVTPAFLRITTWRVRLRTGGWPKKVWRSEEKERKNTLCNHRRSPQKVLGLHWSRGRAPNAGSSLRNHTEAWESITPTQGATPKCGSPSPQLKR